MQELTFKDLKKLKIGDEIFVINKKKHEKIKVKRKYLGLQENEIHFDYINKSGLTFIIKWTNTIKKKPGCRFYDKPLSKYEMINA